MGSRPAREYLPALLLCALSSALPAQEQPFLLRGDRLKVTSSALELVIQGGAVVHIRDRRTGEVLADGDPWPKLKEIPSGSSPVHDWYTLRSRWSRGPSAYAENRLVQIARRRPTPGSVPEFTQVTPTEARLVYRELTNGVAGDELSYTIRIDAEAGDILLSAATRLVEPKRPPLTLDVPLPNLKARAVLLGNGARYTSDDRPVVDYCMRLANNMYSPRIAILEGAQGCVAVWPDTPFMMDNIYLAHRGDANDVILHAGRDYRQRDLSRIESVAWRMGAFRTWVDAARRFRNTFEKRTGARPLWQQTPTWVRNIHAVHTIIPDTDRADEYYGSLAEQFDPRKLLLFYWNGNGIILFGDHRYMTKAVARPVPPVIDAIKKHGFRWMGYHPYVLIFSPSGREAQLEKIRTRGWGLPEGYAFNPDYPGPPDKLYEYFQPISGKYYSGAELWLYHPGSKAGREYLVPNFGNYCKFHRMDGAYFDILGSEHQSMFPKEKKIFDGLNYRMGEERALREIKEAHRGLAIMSEVQSAWTIAHTFYTWEGASHIGLPRSHPSIKTKTDHPLRTALWGSYCWTREKGLDPVYAALLGTLPQLDLDNDWRAARCKLFTEEELFNDLPVAWDPDAYAYYRAKGNRWFQFRKLPFGDGYVELTADGYKVRLARLIGQHRYPLDVPARIQHWVAYKSDRPIGLNPAGTYPFLIEAPKPEPWLRIADLPEGVFINAIRHCDTHSVVEFEAPADQGANGEIPVIFRRKCLRVCDAKRDIDGPFDAGDQMKFPTDIPGALVFVWREPSGIGGSFRPRALWATGRIFRNGIPEPAEHFFERRKLKGRECATVRLYTGRHRGYAEQWIQLADEAEPILKFEALQERVDKESPAPKRPLTFSVRVNGSEVWREQTEAQTEWVRRSVSLEAYAGRTVLVTFSAENVESDRSTAGSFGYVRVVDDPIATEDDDGEATAGDPTLDGLLPGADD